MNSGVPSHSPACFKIPPFPRQTQRGFLLRAAQSHGRHQGYGNALKIRKRRRFQTRLNAGGWLWSSGLTPGHRDLRRAVSPPPAHCAGRAPLCPLWKREGGGRTQAGGRDGRAPAVPRSCAPATRPEPGGQRQSAEKPLNLPTAP